MAWNQAKVLSVDDSDSYINPGFATAREAHLLCGWHWPASRSWCLRCSHHSLRSDPPTSFFFSTLIAVWLGKKRWFWLVPVSFTYQYMKSMNLVSNLRSRDPHRPNRQHFGILLLRRYVSHHLAITQFADNSDSYFG